MAARMLRYSLLRDIPLGHLMKMSLFSVIFQAGNRDAIDVYFLKVVIHDESEANLLQIETHPCPWA